MMIKQVKLFKKILKVSNYIKRKLKKEIIKIKVTLQTLIESCKKGVNLL